MLKAIAYSATLLSCTVAAPFAAWAQDSVQGARSQSSAEPETSRVLTPSPVVVFSLESVLKGSLEGKAVEARIQAMEVALGAENKKIAEELEAEEEEIFLLKKALSEDELKARAEAFDAKVTAIRSAQSEKKKVIDVAREDGIRAFETSMGTVLEAVARKAGAVVVLERKQTYLVSDRVDISSAVIAVLDEQYALAQTGAQGEGADTSLREPQD
jgi:Skp family chaperone for outer membrane proteins